MTQTVFAADACEGISALAKSAQKGFNDVTGSLLFQNDLGASYQATYSMPRGDCKVFRSQDLSPTYECVWDFQKSTPEVVRDRAAQFARDVARCTRNAATARAIASPKTGLPAEWQTVSKQYAVPVNFIISAQGGISPRGERIREISLSVERQ